MPIYPTNPTYVSGFYNNKRTNGTDDRVYSAKDLRMPYSAIFSDGVKPNANGVLGTDLQVQAVSGMQIRVAIGQGMFGGAFFWNKSVYQISLDVASNTNRYDCIIIKADDDEYVRNSTIYVKSLSAPISASDLIRNDTTKEYCLAQILVPALATSVNQSNITDTRLNQNLCGVITGVYNQVDGAAITTQWNTAFNDWFDDIRDEFVSNATLVHHYYNTTISTSVNQRRIAIGISQFDRNTDVLLVMVEGRVFAEGIDYTIFSNSYIDLTIGLPVVGARVMFEVMKSVDGSQAQTVVSQVNTLINQMNVVNNKLQYDYYCNGANDNIQIGNIVRTFLQSGTDYRYAKFNIIGTLGMSLPARGSGTTADPYGWFDFNIGSNRDAIVDFTRCSGINPTITNGSNNVIFHSNNDIFIIGATIVAENRTANTVIRVMNTSSGAIKFEDCRMWITGYKDCIIAKRGTFVNCRGTVTNVINNSYCFITDANSILRLQGGEYYAYAGQSNVESAVVGQSGAQSVSILYGVNMPITARTGFYQTHSIIQFTGGGYVNCTDLVSQLPLSVISGINNVRGTIPFNKPNAM